MSLNMHIISMLNPEFALRIQKNIERNNLHRLNTAEFVDWDPKIKWQKQLNINAESYNQHTLFDVKACEGVANPNRAEPGTFVDSSSGEWRYMHSTLRRGNTLKTWYGSKMGSVMFNGDIIIPCIYQRSEWNADRFEMDSGPWMSLTPSEVISLRGGTRRTKGKVVVAGLGMGYQLRDVMARKQVKEVILIEKSKELVDWLLPRIRPFLADKPLKIIIGCVFEELPKLTADVALVDTFPMYGNNGWAQRKLRYSCKNIDYVWCWGAAEI